MTAGEASESGTAPVIEVTHTASFGELLNTLPASVLVSTYQANKLAVLRPRDGVVNTHFRHVPKPMGLARQNERMALGVNAGIRFYEFHSEYCPPPEEGAPPYDGTFVPTNEHVTGGIDIHEMEYDSDGTLWFINTRLSCLCRYHPEYSFEPVWRPDFVTALSPEDRCHLNGLALVDGRPRFVSALGVSDLPGGWRENKASGGVVIDIDCGETVLEGLSMPHSPRYYNGALWVLESGNGSLMRVDMLTGQRENVILLPGFTRGLDFVGPFAFIGLSQVRETAVFSGLPLTQRPEERVCGVAVVDLRDRQLVGYLRFEQGVREIFAVRALPGIPNPEFLEPYHEHLANCFRLPPGHEVLAPRERLE